MIAIFKALNGHTLTAHPTLNDVSVHYLSHELQALETAMETGYSSRYPIPDSVVIMVINQMPIEVCA